MPVRLLLFSSPPEMTIKYIRVKRANVRPLGMITREQIQEMFHRMRNNARWDIDDFCLWGYFFTDHERRRLVTAAPALERMGYRVVGILEPVAESDDQELLFLHVEREERHTVDSLEARNRELYHFADEFDLESYDGMDVGPIAQQKRR